MNLSFSLKEINGILDELTSAGAVTEYGVFIVCLGLSWLICSVLRRLFNTEGSSVLFGKRVVEGLLFPVLALMLAFLARYLLAGVAKAAVFKVAIPILVSLVLIRLAVRVLTVTFPTSPWVKTTERTISWLAWIAVTLWITGVLPLVMDELDSVHWKIGSMRMSLRTLIEGTLTGSVVMIVVLWISSALEKKIIRGTGSDLSMRKMVSNIVRAVLLSVGLLLAMSAVGIDLTALSVLGGAFGVGLGLGLQKIAANYVSGFVILAERSLRIGDFVKIDGFEGRITDIRTRYTVIRALSGREALVPNEMLITQRVENASLVTAETTVLISVAVQVAHGTDVRALQPRLEAALAEIPRVLQNPPPFVQLTGFVPNGMELQVKYWLADPNHEQDLVKSQANLAVLDALTAEGIEFPGPQRIFFQGMKSDFSDDKSG